MIWLRDRLRQCKCFQQDQHNQSLMDLRFVKVRNNILDCHVDLPGDNYSAGFLFSCIVKYMMDFLQAQQTSFETFICLNMLSVSFLFLNWIIRRIIGLLTSDVFNTTNSHLLDLRFCKVRHNLKLPCWSSGR